MAGLAPTWLKIILCCLIWVTAARPSELEAILRKNPRDPISLWNDNSDGMKAVDWDCSARAEPQDFADEFTFSNRPYSDPLGEIIKPHPVSNCQPRLTDISANVAAHVGPMESRPSEEKDGHDVAYDQGAVSYYREGIGSKRRLIQAAAKPVAHHKSSGTDGGAAPHLISRLALGGNEEQINQFLRLQGFLPDAENEAHSENAGMLWQTGQHDRKGVGSSEIVQVAQQHHPLIHPADSPLQTETPSERSQTASETEADVGERVRPNKRRKVNQPVQSQTTIDQVIETPTIPEPQPQSPIDPTSDPGNQANKKQGPKNKKGEKATLFPGCPQMSTLDNRVQNALPHQDSSAKEEFRMIREKFDEKHQEIYKLYTDSLIWSYTETLTEELGGLVMIVRRYGQPEKHGGRYLWNARIRLPLRTRNQQEKGYSLARRKIDTLLELLNWYHNLFSLNGLDREILGREEGNHGKLLEWFYEQLFVDTDDHPLLLGEAKVGGQEPNPKKTFTTAQKRLYETLVGTARLAGLEAVRLAFDLLELWYRAEFSSLSTRPFSAVDYPAQLLQAVRNYPPRYPTHKMAKQRVLH